MFSELQLKVVGVAFALLLVSSAVFGGLAWNAVDEGTVDVVTEWGDSTGETLQPGANWITPVKQGTVTIPTRPQEYTMSEDSGEGDRANKDDSVEVLTNDGVAVDVDVTVRYRVNKDEAVTFYDEYKGLEQAEARLIRPTTRSVLRTEGGDIDTTEIYTGEGQDQMRDAVWAALEDEFDGSGLVLEAVQIRRIHLPDSYATAVEQKEVEKQKVMQKQSEIERQKLEAEREIIEAEGQAEANEIVAKSLKDNPELIQIRYIEALKENENVVYVGAGEQAGIALTKDVDDEDE